MDQDWQERLMAQLDEDAPCWHYLWASQEDLCQAAFDHRAGHNEEWVEGRIRNRVAQRLFRPIIQAALGAGIVREAE